VTSASVDGGGGLSLVVDSRCSAMRRELGPAAWVVLEELLSSAVVDVDLAVAVCRTSVRHLAKATALSKDTVSRSLNRLRGSKLLRFEREQHDDSGRFVSVRYLVDITKVPMTVRTGNVQEGAVVPTPIPALPPVKAPERAALPRPVIVPGKAQQLSVFGD
jgi:DNA-binding transcriptional ArsR family regulator